jgi:hypothetical protein
MPLVDPVTSAVLPLSMSAPFEWLRTIDDAE